MNNAHLYTVVTKLEEAERNRLLAGQPHRQQSLAGSIAATMAQVTGLYQRWKTGKSSLSAQAAAEAGGLGWQATNEATVDQPLGVE